MISKFTLGGDLEWSWSWSFTGGVKSMKAS